MELESTSQVQVELVSNLDSQIAELRDCLEKRAYEKYVERGIGQGGELDDWLLAEQELFVKTTILEPRIEGDEIVIEIIVPQVQPGNLKVFVSPGEVLLLSDPLAEGRRVFEIRTFPLQVHPERIEAEYVIDTLFVIAPIRRERENCEAA